MIQVWGVAPAQRYRISGNLLVEDGAGTRSYDPASNPRLLQAITRFHLGRVTAEKFASDFGLFGFDRLLPHDRGIARQNFSIHSDPIEWMRAHARGVSVAFELLTALPDIPPWARDLDDAISPGRLEPADYGVLAEVKRIDFRWIKEEFEFANSLHRKQKTGVTPFMLVRHQAHKIVSSIINPNIARIRHELTFTSDGRVVPMIRFSAMIEAAYWQLANRLTGSFFRNCQGCGLPLITSKSKQFFCTTQCNQRYRSRKFYHQRTKSKEEKQP